MKTVSSLLAIASAVACGPTFAADDSTTTPRVSKERAQEAALRAVPGEVLHWDLQVADGNPEYAFYIKRKDGRISEVEMDGNSGKKTHVGIALKSGGRDGRERKTTNQSDLVWLRKAKLTREKAQVKALEAYPGSIEYWELLVWETGKEGTLVYEFRIASASGKRVVAVDSRSGKVMSISTFVEGSRI